MKFIGLNIFFILVLFTTFSCKRKDITYLIEDDDIRYAATFKNGSYWVYKDSATGIEDSLTASFGSRLATASADSDNPKIYFEQVFCEINRGNQGVGSVFAYAPAPSEENIVVGGLYFDKSVRQLTKPFAEGRVYTVGKQGTNKAVEIINSLSVGDSVYQNIYHHYLKFVSCIGCTDTTFVHYYFSTDLGFVKTTIRQGGIYTAHELVRYKVIK